MNKQTILTSLLLLLTISGLWAQQIDQDQSVVNFSVSNLGINTVKGTISEMEGTVAFNATDLTNSRFDTRVAVKTIHTDNEERDEHLRTEDFFEVETYPAIRFVSSDIKKSGSKYEATGTLTIKDVSKEVTIPFTVEKSGNATTFTGNIKVKRKDYHVGETYGSFMVGSDIKVQIVCVVKE